MRRELRKRCTRNDLQLDSAIRAYDQLIIARRVGSDHDIHAGRAVDGECFGD